MNFSEGPAKMHGILLVELFIYNVCNVGQYLHCMLTE